MSNHERTIREHLESKAESGDSKAMVDLGKLLLASGKAVDRANAISWLRRAADAGVPEANYRLGMAFLNGEGVSLSWDAAVEQIRLSAELGWPDALNWLGEYYVQCDPPRFKEAQACFREGAEHGHARAMANLGVMYSRGEGVPREASSALAWFGKAAAMGEPLALGNLGALFLVGELVGQDSSRGAAYLHRAAEKEPFAHLILARHYREGNGLKKSPRKAIKHFNKAIAGGVLQAQVELAQILAAGEGIKPDQRRALALLREAAEAGNAEACFALGREYYGINSSLAPKDLEQSKRWMMRAAQLGNAQAKSWINAAPWE